MPSFIMFRHARARSSIASRESQVPLRRLLLRTRQRYESTVIFCVVVVCALCVPPGGGYRKVGLMFERV